MKDDPDSEITRPGRVPNGDFLSPEKKLTGVGLDDASKNLGQGAFARAVLSTKGVDFPRPQVKAGVLQGINAAIMLLDPPAL